MSPTSRLPDSKEVKTLKYLRKNGLILDDVLVGGHKNVELRGSHLGLDKAPRLR